MHTIELTDEELRLLQNALHAYLDDFGHEEADVLREVKALIAKLQPGVSALRVERDGDVLRVTLARPERRNAFDADADRGARATRSPTSATRAPSSSPATGRASAPAPTSSGSARRSTSRYEENVEDYRRLYRMLESICRCPAPVVARVQGYALGGGSGLIACADIAIAGDGRRLRLLRGAARDHPGRDLADGAGADRPGGRAALLPHRRAVRRARRRSGSASSTRSPPTSTRRSSASSPTSSPAGPIAVREAKRLVLEPGDEEDVLAARRRAADERRGAGRAARLPREARLPAMGHPEAPRSEPRRDRGAHLPHLPRARDRDRRGRRARRRGRAAHARSPTRRSRSRPTSTPRSTSAPRSRSGADAIHPGYGFLAENADFAEAVEAAGLVFVGPSPEALRAGGDKLAAKRVAREAGVPVLDEGDPAELGFPLLVKAAAGGGGRGMRVVRSAAELDEALEAARREAKAAFGDDTVFCERYLERPRHVEIQLLGDGAGRRGRARRARVLGAAPPPEGARGVALARARRRSCARR